jgi:plasmid stabilization system protein ParE
MRRFQEALAAAARLIGAHPAAGRHELQLADERYRFWSLRGFPYLLVYRPTSRPPLILRVVHTSRDLGPLLANLAGPPDTDEPSAGPSQVWGSGGNGRLRVCIIGGLESLSEAGTERPIVDGAANLEQEIGPSSRPAHLL